MPVILETERLLLRNWSLDDVEAAFRMYGDPEVGRWLGGRVMADLDAQRADLERILPIVEGWAPRGLGFWPAVDKASGELIGAGLLKPIRYSQGEEDAGEIEVGWHLAQAHWGKGFGTEMGRRCLDHGFKQLGLERVIAVAHPENQRSTHIMEKLGMRRVGITQRYYDTETVLYEIDAKDYR